MPMYSQLDCARPQVQLDPPPSPPAVPATPPVDTPSVNQAGQYQPATSYKPSTCPALAQQATALLLHAMLSKLISVLPRYSKMLHGCCLVPVGGISGSSSCSTSR